MKQFIFYLAVAVFAIFIGAQITEGMLLVPYWQSLSPEQFYSYYSTFGPSIGGFFTVLTLLAALMPVALAVYCKMINSKGLKWALISVLFAVLFIASFYFYFKGTNELFYQSELSADALRNELVTWSQWHWGRVVIEFLSLGSMVIALSKLRNAVEL